MPDRVHLSTFVVIFCGHESTQVSRIQVGTMLLKRQRVKERVFMRKVHEKEVSDRNGSDKLTRPVTQQSSVECQRYLKILPLQRYR